MHIGYDNDTRGVPRMSGKLGYMLLYRVVNSSTSFGTTVQSGKVKGKGVSA